LNVLCLDPLYMSLLAGASGVDPSNMYAMGPVFDTFARACLDLGCTPYVAHHFVKNREDKYKPPELEALAFSGANQFARQWMLIDRREKYDHNGIHRLFFVYGGSAGHDGLMHLDIDAGTVGDSLHDGRKWNVTASSPDEGREADEAGRMAVAKAKADAKVAEDNVKAEATLLNRCAKVKEAMRVLIGRNVPATAAKIREQSALNSENTKAALARCILDEQIEEYQATVQAGKATSYTAYQFVSTEGRRPGFSGQHD
jgi:hypothetical protein